MRGCLTLVRTAPKKILVIGEDHYVGTKRKSISNENRSGRVQARIGKTVKIKGELTGSEDFHVDGEIEGTIELPDNALVVGPNGNVRAQVKARSITIWGNLEGKVHASEGVEVRKTGSLTGDLVTARIVTEDGAVFRGSIILKPETNEKSPPPRKGWVSR